MKIDYDEIYTNKTFKRKGRRELKEILKKKFLCVTSANFASLRLN